MSPAPAYPPLSPPPVMSYMDPSQHWLPSPSHSPMPMPYYPYAPHAPLPYQPMVSPHAMVQPHVILPRPGSAEPIPSQPLYNVPSGLPVSSVQQPLIPLVVGSRGMTPPVVEREEGKGERASRVSHHLRMSSRNRSVSPQAHRYPLPAAPEPYQAPPPVPVPTTLSPSSPDRPVLQTLDIPSTVASSPPGDVVSPRPMLSPKHSFSVDPVTHATLSKSDRVRTLEHMAAQAEKTNSDMSTDIPDVNFADKDKTLPIPPVPSEKPKPRSAVSESRPRADTLFAPDQEPEETPPTPTLAAVTSLKVPRFGAGGAGGGLSGLDALEARLIAEVGTKKVEQNDRRPDVRSVLPQPIAIPHRNAEIEPAVDSAISSLRLPGVEVEEPPKPSLSGLLTVEPIERAESAHSNPHSHDGARTERGRAKERVSDGLTKKSAGKKGTRKGKDHASAERDDEVHRMRKVAQGRVTSWLERIDPAVPPDVDSSASPSPAPERLSQKPKDEEIEPEPQAIVPPPEVTVKAEKDAAKEDVVAQPNPRSSGFVPMETLRARQMQAEASGKKDGLDEKPFGIPRGLKFAYPPRPSDAQANYDVRSARGGRGGQVTAVAAIWASQAQITREQNKSPPPIKPPKSNKAIPKYLSPQPTKPALSRTPPAITRSPTNHLSIASPPASFSAANLTEKRAKMIKATSVPAVLSSSLATPMLSSTASLARPSPPLMDRVKFGNKLLPTVAETRPTLDGQPEPKSTSSPAPKGELAFGQARLRELIKRYQGQTS